MNLVAVMLSALLSISDGSAAGPDQGAPNTPTARYNYDAKRDSSKYGLLSTSEYLFFDEDGVLVDALADGNIEDGEYLNVDTYKETDSYCENPLFKYALKPSNTCDKPKLTRFMLGEKDTKTLLKPSNNYSFIYINIAHSPNEGILFYSMTKDLSGVKLPNPSDLQINFIQINVTDDDSYTTTLDVDFSSLYLHSDKKSVAFEQFDCIDVSDASDSIKSTAKLTKQMATKSGLYFNYILEQDSFLNITLSNLTSIGCTYKKYVEYSLVDSEFAWQTIFAYIPIWTLFLLMNLILIGWNLRFIRARRHPARRN